MDGDYWFNAEEADRVVEWWESTLCHGEGIWAGHPFILRDWQREEMVRPLFGWMRWDEQYELWVRRFSRGSLWLPRGNGKTPIAAGVILVGLVADGEMGAQNYGAAEDRDQASIVFRDVRLMVKHSPSLEDRLTVLDSRKRIVDEQTDSFYLALPRDELGEGSQGFKPHISVVDEYHVQKTKLLVDALKKGMGKRLQSLFLTISTAGEDPDNTPAGEDYKYAKKVRDARTKGEDLDPGLFIYIAEADLKDDPWDERTWAKANPALGDFLSPHTVREESREAQEKPSEKAQFLRYRLNIWNKDVSATLPLEMWDKGGRDLMIELEEDLKGEQCWGGLDLANTQDVNALVWDFPDPENPDGEPDGREHKALFRFWIPEERLEDFDKRTGGQASVWVSDGYLRTTPGNVTDYGTIEKQIREDGRNFHIQQLGFDPWNAGWIVQQLEDAPFECIEIRQTFEQLAEPTKAWERLIFRARYRHGGHPVMRWMVGNVVPDTDGAGNWKISKKKSKEKVDGPAASVMALKLARLGISQPQYGAYGF
jgi:phage terminase large subunit-like protein